MVKISKNATIAGTIYFILYLLSYAYFLMRYTFDKFSGIFLVVFTAPWTELAVLARSQFGIERELSFVAINVIVWISAMINIVAIFLLSQKYLTKRSSDNKDGSI